MKPLFLIFCLVFIAVEINGKPYSLFGKYGEENNECKNTCPEIDVNKINVHIVPHSHDDVGWLKTVDQYYYGHANYIQRAGVQYIIESVVAALQQNPERKFIQVETAFFHKWWKKQSNAKKEAVRKLVNDGQLEIVGGGWSMNDEGCVHYQSIIDQFSFGLKVLNDTLGPCGRPKTGWQIDPFGHSREMGSILTQMDYSGLFFARLDWRDKTQRLTDRKMEFLWKTSPNLGNSSDLFTSVLYNHYSAPSGFCFDILCNDDPIIDDETIPDYNYKRRIEDFAEFVKKQSQYFGSNIIITMGDDFNYGDALSYFTNLDLLIQGFKKFPQQLDGKEINVFYSTPNCYVKSVKEALKKTGKILSEKTDDFFPYASDYHAYWSGYFTSRPTSKRFERQGNNLLQVTKQLAVLNNQEEDEGIIKLKEAMGIMQHHDAITGTEKQHVADDYARILTEAFEKAEETNAKNLMGILHKTEELPLVFETCLLANMSLCKVSESSSSFLVTLYNPLSWNISEFIRLPVSSTSFTILDSTGTELVYDILPVIDSFAFLNASTSKYELVFKATLPPHAIKSYFISKNKEEIRKPTSTEEKTKLEKINQNNKLIKLGDENNGFAVNEETGLLESLTIDGLTVKVKQELMYYIGSLGDNSVFEERASGAYIFRPSAYEPEAQSFTQKANYTIYKGNLVEEVHQTFGTWTKQIIRMYKSTNNLEIDWLIGPIDISDGQGREVISRFTTELDSDDLFYTDSNGREMLKRKRNYRETYNYSNEEPIAGNYYPVTSKIVLKDLNRRIDFSVLNDRSQGGTSLKSGELELMLHRRLLNDDAFGVGEALNEEAFNQGLVARGRHFITIASTTNSAKKTRNLAIKKLLEPWKFVADTSGLSFEQIKNNYKLDFYSNVYTMPENVHILSLEPWKNANEQSEEKQILIRLEHIFEKDEDPELSKEVTVDLTTILSETKMNLLVLEETTLDGNKIKSTKLFNNNEDKEKNYVVTLKPMEIKTFLVTYN